MKQTANSYVGRTVAITPGTRVTTAGRTYTRKIGTNVTVRAQETTRTGKTRIVWKSHGYRATAVLG